MTRQHRRAQRRAESRFFEAIEAADAGDLRLANELLERAAPPRRTRPTTIEKERTSIQRGVSSSPTDFT
jgi:phage shock protein A